MAAGITEALAAAAGAVKEGLKLKNTIESRKYADRIANLELEILREEGKGYDSDDAKIETLYKELGVAFRAAQNEMALRAPDPGK